MKRPLLLLSLTTTIATATAAGLEVQIETLNKAADTYPQAVIKLTNGTPAAYRLIKVECAFLRAGKAIGTNDTRIENVGAGQTAYGKVVLLQNDRADKAECRVTDTRK